jgi:hypothetical protein
MSARSFAVAALATVAVGLALLLLLGGGSSPSCRDLLRCGPLRDGRPIDPADVPDQVAGMAIDSEPSYGFSSRCRFRGIAGGRADVYRCSVTGGVDGHLILKLAHDRASPWYRYEVLAERGALDGWGGRRGETGDCAVLTSPACPEWSAYGERLAKALLPP